MSDADAKYVNNDWQCCVMRKASGTPFYLPSTPNARRVISTYKPIHFAIGFFHLPLTLTYNGNSLSLNPQLECCGLLHGSILFVNFRS